MSKNVIFKNIEGMTELNYSEKNKKIWELKKKEKNTFFIGDTSRFSDYKAGGYVEEAPVPKKIDYKSLSEKWMILLLKKIALLMGKENLFFLFFKL